MYRARSTCVKSESTTVVWIDWARMGREAGRRIGFGGPVRSSNLSAFGWRSGGVQGVRSKKSRESGMVEEQGTRKWWRRGRDSGGAGDEEVGEQGPR